MRQEESMISQSISRTIIAIVKLVSLIAMAIIIIGCPSEPATPGDGGGNGDGNGDGNGGGSGSLSIGVDGDPDMAGVQSIMAIDEREGGDAITVATLLATVSGGGAPPSDIVYTIAASSGAHSFVITGDSLILPAGAAVDYDALPEGQQTGGIPLTIQASGGSGITASVDIAVPIGNTDDEAPVFGTIPEGVTVVTGTTTISGGMLTIAATDGDAAPVGNDAEISYALVDDADAAVAPNEVGLSIFGGFAINAATGVITVETAPVYAGDATDTRMIAIRATDTSSGVTGAMTTDATLVITVIASSTIDLMSSTGATITIDESDAAFIAVTTITAPGTTLDSTDPYAIVGNPASFAINNAGEITAQVDYEALSNEQQTNGITITAQAIGSIAGQNGSIELTIMVTNTDDEAPVFGAIPEGVTVESGTTTISGGTLTIAATDGDAAPAGNNGEISYALVDGSGDAVVPNGAGLSIFGGFAIDANSGVITVATAPVFSDATPADNTRMIAIRATDTSSGVTGDMTTDATLVITVIAPSVINLMSSAGAAITIDESDVEFIAVTTITAPGATLADTNPYAIAGNPASFAINAMGEITAQLDYEALSNEQQTNGITITAQATGSIATQNGNIELTIMVTNTDDEAPVIDPESIPAAAVTVEAGTKTLSEMIDIDATDSVDGFMVVDDEISYAFSMTLGRHRRQIPTCYLAIAMTATGEITVETAPTYNPANFAANRIELTVQARDTSTGASGALTVEADIVISILPFADTDGDGLIEIYTLEALNNIRHNLAGTSYKTTAAEDPGDTRGCPEDGCVGYELMRNLDFAEAASYAANAVNTDWRPNNPDPSRATNPGWEPIGSTANLFTTIFEGNGYTITGLYTRRAPVAGLFGATGETASIRRVGLIDGGSYNSNSVGMLAASNNGTIVASYATGDVGGGSIGNGAGGLVGRNENTGTIIASYATGDVDGNSGNDDVGGLVGHNLGTIVASYATGDVDGGLDDDTVGGLVGENGGTIVASYATGNAYGNNGRDDNVGGLVGENGGTIIASYATGDGDGGSGHSDEVGGLVGQNLGTGTIVASYATGDVDGKLGNSDAVGRLVGQNLGTGTTTASYGFGATLNGEISGVDRSADADPSIHSPAALTAANSSTMTADQWDEDVWSFGDDRRYPVVKWVTGYDATAETFSCDQTMLPDGQTCGNSIPGQHDSDDDGTQDMVPAAVDANRGLYRFHYNNNMDGARRNSRNHRLSRLPQRDRRQQRAWEPPHRRSRRERAFLHRQRPARRREPLRRLRGERRGRRARGRYRQAL